MTFAPILLAPDAPTLPPEERGWRLDALNGLLGYCLSIARMLHGQLHGPAANRTADTFGWPLLLGRVVLAMRRLTRLMVLTAAGVAPPEPNVSVKPRPAEPEQSSCPPGARPRGARPRILSFGDVMVPGAAAFALALKELLAEPDMAALLANDPRVGRIVRPLCRLLDIRLDEVVYPIPGLELEPDETKVVSSGFPWAEISGLELTEPGPGQLPGPEAPQKPP